MNKERENGRDEVEETKHNQSGLNIRSLNENEKDKTSIKSEQEVSAVASWHRRNLENGKYLNYSQTINYAADASSAAQSQNCIISQIMQPVQYPSLEMWRAQHHTYFSPGDSTSYHCSTSDDSSNAANVSTVTQTGNYITSPQPLHKPHEYKWPSRNRTRFSPEVSANNQCSTSDDASSVGISDYSSPLKKTKVDSDENWDDIGNSDHVENSANIVKSNNYEICNNPEILHSTPITSRRSTSAISHFPNSRSQELLDMKSVNVFPMYRRHQLLGDSQLLRFTETYLKEYRKYTSYTEDKKAKRIGYCVSGQKIRDLESRLTGMEFKIHEYVIMLIGTNDLSYYGSPIKAVCDTYDSILSTLKKHASRIVLLTVPPIPKFEHDTSHWKKLEELNNFILSKKNNKDIFVVDLASVFITYNNKVSRNYYEETINGQRVDLIHLNRDGFVMLKAVLEAMYFNKNV